MLISPCLRTSTLRAEDLDGVRGRVQHVEPRFIRANFNRHAHAITLGPAHHAEHPEKLSIPAETLEACRWAGFSGDDIAMTRESDVFGLAAAAELLRLHPTGLAELRNLLAVAVMAFDSMPRVVRHPEIAVISLDVHLAAATTQLLQDELGRFEIVVEAIDAEGKVIGRWHTDEYVLVRDGNAGEIRAPLLELLLHFTALGVVVPMHLFEHHLDVRPHDDRRIGHGRDGRGNPLPGLVQPQDASAARRKDGSVASHAD